MKLNKNITPYLNRIKSETLPSESSLIPTLLYSLRASAFFAIRSIDLLLNYTWTLIQGGNRKSLLYVVHVIFLFRPLFFRSFGKKKEQVKKSKFTCLCIIQINETLAHPFSQQIRDSGKNNNKPNSQEMKRPS